MVTAVIIISSVLLATSETGADRVCMCLLVCLFVCMPGYGCLCVRKREVLSGPDCEKIVSDKKKNI